MLLLILIANTNLDFSTYPEIWEKFKWNFPILYVQISTPTRISCEIALYLNRCAQIIGGVGVIEKRPNISNVKMWHWVICS